MYSGNRVTYYPELSKTLRGEYMDYTFPISIQPIRYEVGFSSDSIPIKWYLMGKINNGPWSILDSQSNNATGSYQISNTSAVDAVRLHVTVSSAPSIKIREFRIFDQFGENTPFMVPFCTNTNSVHPSGTLNFSCIDSFSLDAPLQTDFYAVGHSTLEIEKGMCTNVI